MDNTAGAELSDVHKMSWDNGLWYHDTQLFQFFQVSWES